MIDNELRYNTFLSSPEPISELYSSYELAVFLTELLKDNQNADQGKELIGDTILGFYKIADLPRLFQQKLNLSADESQRITSKLIDILSPVVRREEEEAKKKKEELHQLTQTFSKPSASAEPVKDAQQFAEKIEPIKTMEEDMHRVHGYGAYREQIEQEEKKIASSQDDLLKKN